MKSRMLVSLLVIALAAAVIGGATMAWFTDSDVAAPVTFTAGTLMIDIDDPLLTETFDVNIENLNPGDCMEWTFDVENAGTKSANWLLYMCWRGINGQENMGEGYFGDRDGYGNSLLSEVLLWTITVDGNVVYGENAELDAAPLILDELEAFAAGPGTTKTVTVKACLPGLETGNEYQGATMDIRFGVEAWQTTNDAPAPDMDDFVCPWDVEEPEEPGEPGEF